MAAAAVNQRGKESRMSTVRRTRTELKRTTSVQLSRGSREAEIGARPGLEGEVAHLEVELEAVEERVSRRPAGVAEGRPMEAALVMGPTLSRTALVPGPRACRHHRPHR